MAVSIHDFADGHRLEAFVKFPASSYCSMNILHIACIPRADQARPPSQLCAGTLVSGIVTTIAALLLLDSSHLSHRTEFNTSGGLFCLEVPDSSGEQAWGKLPACYQ